MSDSVAKLTFWGVRGSTPTPDRNTWRYGGNTPCLEFESPSGTRIILDCGTGLRSLGNQWGTEGDDPIEAHVLVTHYHWDHIQGIPFFTPFYSPQNKFHFYSFQSTALGRDSLRQVLEAQLARPYFPVDVSIMKAPRDFQEISGGDQFEIEGTRISACWLNHPQGCLGYRLDTPFGSIAYATDNEPGNPELDDNLRQLASGAQVFIQDAQYSPEFLATSRRGWGHSTWLEGVKVAREAKAQNLVLFHHDPDSSDRTVDGYLQAARQEFRSSWAATEGMMLTLGEKGLDVTLRETRIGQRRPVEFDVTVTGSSADGRPFEEKATLRDLSLQGAFLVMCHRPLLQSDLTLVIEAHTKGNQSSVLTLQGTVIRSEPSMDKKHTGVGIVFIEDPETTRASD